MAGGLMYGVPPDLPLDRFVGRECSLIGIGRFEIRFLFPDAGDIYVQGGWEIRDGSGGIVDRSLEHAARNCYRAHVILDSPVQRFVVEPPSSFTLYFENGFSLTIFDDSEQFESFSIQPDGIYV